VLEKLLDISVLRNENERLKEQLARTQAALAESEEARQRLGTIVVDIRREKFGADPVLLPDTTTNTLLDTMAPAIAQQLCLILNAIKNSPRNN